MLVMFSNRLTLYIAWFQWTDKHTDRQADRRTKLIALRHFTHARAG